MNRKSGYTLTELLVVVTIVLFVLGLLLPATSRIYGRARIAEAKATIDRLKQALALYEADWGFYPPSAQGGLLSGGGGAATIGSQHNGNSCADLGYDALPGPPYERWNNLVAALTTTERNGPYFELEKKDIAFEKDATRYEIPADLPNLTDGDLRWCRVLLDPWNRAYVYTCRDYYNVPNSQWQMVGDEYTGPNSPDGMIIQNNPYDVKTWGPFYPYYDPTATGAQDTLLGNNTYNIYSLGPDGATFDDGDEDPNDSWFVPTELPGGVVRWEWDNPGLYDNPEDGNPSREDTDDYNNDDICSW